jgi:hypothetical protein
MVDGDHTEARPAERGHQPAQRPPAVPGATVLRLLTQALAEAALALAVVALALIVLG